MVHAHHASTRTCQTLQVRCQPLPQRHPPGGLAIPAADRATPGHPRAGSHPRRGYPSKVLTVGPFLLFRQFRFLQFFAGSDPLFDLLNSLSKAAVGVVTLPVSVAADVVTLGGSLTDRQAPYTADHAKAIVDNVFKAVEPK